WPAHSSTLGEHDSAGSLASGRRRRVHRSSVCVPVVGIDTTAVSPLGKGISRAQEKLVEALLRLDLPYEVVALVRESTGAALPDSTPTISVGGGIDLVTEQLNIPLALASR